MGRYALIDDTAGREEAGAGFVIAREMQESLALYLFLS